MAGRKAPPTPPARPSDKPTISASAQQGSAFAETTAAASTPQILKHTLLSPRYCSADAAAGARADLCLAESTERSLVSDRKLE